MQGVVSEQLCMNIQVFWDTVPCRLVHKFRRFREVSCFSQERSTSRAQFSLKFIPMSIKQRDLSFEARIMCKKYVIYNSVHTHNKQCIVNYKTKR